MHYYITPSLHLLPCPLLTSLQHIRCLARAALAMTHSTDLHTHRMLFLWTWCSRNRNSICNESTTRVACGPFMIQYSIVQRLHTPHECKPPRIMHHIHITTYLCSHVCYSTVIWRVFFSLWHGRIARST
jgi:hypothetical protein